MKRSTSKRWFCLLISISVLGLPTVASADRTYRSLKAHGTDAESNVEIEIFGISDSTSTIGNAQVGTSGVLVETEYEANNMVYSFNFERWNYNWTNPANLPFAPGIASDPWSTFNTLQFGFAYEHEINDQWEFNYYLEAESSFEKETSNSREFEAGIDFVYDLSKSWAFTLNVNYEYLDAEEGELGLDLAIEWNHDAKEGWSGEIEISSEFPETTLRYHFTREFSTSVFYNESGTNTIRLSDSSPVPGMQGGYFEDQYNALGIKLDYELARKNYLSFVLQKNTGRQFSFVDKAGRVETAYDFGDSVEMAIKYLYIF